jgi:Glu-tRNA(Gln) amidotransferase subunit E-like FAD-binding protein
LPVPIWEREAKYRSIGVPNEHIEKLAMSPFAKMFEKAIDELKIDLRFASRVLIEFPARLKKEHLPIKQITPEIFNSLFTLLSEGKIVKSCLYFILRESLVSGKPVEEIVQPLSKPEEIKEVVIRSIEKLKTLNIRKPERTNTILMGMIMDQLRFRASGSEVEKVMNEILGGM